MLFCGRVPLDLFCPRVLLEDGLVPATIRIADGRIVAVMPGGQPHAGAALLPAGAILAPGFLDVQVNGGGGVLFNDNPTPDAIARIVDAHRDGGTTGMLPTLITDAPGLIARAADAVARARTRPASGVLGLHLEGPFISPRRPGVHAQAHIRPLARAERDEIAAIGRAGQTGRILLTLAPEAVSPDDLAFLVDAGIVLAAGHTEADPDTLRTARAHGLTGYTHLWNAMPPIAGRAPGPVAAALLDREAFCGVIADLHHVDAANLALTWQAKGAGLLFLVTDAMPPAGTEDRDFMLQGRRIRRHDGRLATEDGVLAGADLTMIEAVRNMGSRIGVDLADALRMASTSPAAFLRLPDRGRIAPGCHADLVALSAELAVLDTAIEGVWRHRARE